MHFLVSSGLRLPEIKMQTEKHLSQCEMQTNARYELLFVSAVTRRHLD